MNFKLNLESIQGLEIFYGVNLKRYTTYKLEVFGDIALVKSITALKEVLKLLKQNKYLYNIVGWGANQILANTKDVLFLRLDFEFDNSLLQEPQAEYYLPASVPLNVLTSHAQKFGLAGWEVFTGVPASLGGAIYMNAGTGLGEICEVVKSVEVLDLDGNIRKVAGPNLKFEYRKNLFLKSGEIIVAATLVHKGLRPEIPKKIKEYLEFRKETQPINTKSCGCVFKNFSPEIRAGQSIDLLGLKGFKYGGLMVSPKHANFIVNQENGSAEDFCRITEIILDELEYTTGIRFELEAKIY